MSRKRKVDGIDDCDLENILAGDIFLFHLLPYMEEDLMKRHITASSADPGCKHMYDEYTKKDKDRMCATFGTALKPQSHSSINATEEARQVTKYFTDRVRWEDARLDPWCRLRGYMWIHTRDPLSVDALLDILKRDVIFALHISMYEDLLDARIIEALGQTHIHTVGLCQLDHHDQYVTALLKNPNIRCFTTSIAISWSRVPVVLSSDIPHIRIEYFPATATRDVWIGDNTIHTLMYKTKLNIKNSGLPLYKNTTSLPRRLMFLDSTYIRNSIDPGQIFDRYALADVWVARRAHLKDVWFSPYGTTAYTRTNDRTEIDAEFELYEVAK